MDELHEQPESLERNVDPETEALEELLDQLWDDGAMDLEELDGFFAALHCCPELVPPALYLPEILGDATENQEIFPGPEAAHLFFGLILHYWNAVSDAFHEGATFEPLLREDEHGKVYGNNWSLGFLRGLELREEAWREILDNEEKFGWLGPILALAQENDPDPEMRSYQEPVGEELREELLQGLAEMVTHLYQYFAPHRLLNATVAVRSGDASPGKQKIGRNDPCYCGSGRKYKKCCGAIKVN